MRSKWQSLPTEQINPSTLAIDKLEPADIVEQMLNEDRRMLAAVHREKERIAVGVEIITQALRKHGRVIFVTCDPHTELQTFVDITIAPAVGPEVIAGSTRLKAGTATKIVLNMLTTGAMVRIGKTYGNLMVDVQTGSEKLRDRARRILSIVTGLEYDEADKLLRRAHWNVKAAIVMQKSGLTYPRALARLRRSHDFVRDAIGEDVEERLKEVLRLG